MTLNTSRFVRKPFILAVASVALIATGCGKAATPEGETLPDETTQEQPAPTSDAASSKAPTKMNNPVTDLAAQNQVLAKYASIDPQHLVPTDLLKKAILYYDANLANIKNKAYLTVVDFAKKSNYHRFFIVDMTTGAVWGLPVAHGKGSDPSNSGFATIFSNVNGSEASSVGYYLTAETYNGTHGLSLRIDGLSSTNSNVRSRAVVVHGATYVQDREVQQGRSWGCFALPMAYYQQVIGEIKNGSLIFADRSAED